MIWLAVLLAAPVAWIALLGLVRWLERPHPADPGPLVGGLGPESPAVANYLAHGFRVTGEAVPATLIDLAAHDVVEIIEIAPGRLVCEVQGVPEDLRPYERQVLEHLVERSAGGVVPAPELTTGWDEESADWSSEFIAEVVAEAEAAALCRDGSGPFAWILVVGSIVLGALAAVAWFATPWSEVDAAAKAGVVLALIAAGVVACAWVGAPPRRHPTEAGRAAAARWAAKSRQLAGSHSFEDRNAASVAMWDEYLAYATALGVGRAASHGLPFGTDGSRWAWGSADGSWRRVRLRYPRGWPPAWGRRRSTAAVMAVGSLLLAFGLAALVDVATSAAVQIVLALGAIASVVWALAALVAVLRDFGRDREVSGEVMRRWIWCPPWWNPWRDLVGSRGFVAIDDGTSDSTRGLVVQHWQFDQLHEGDVVRVTVTPGLHRVRSIELLYTRSRA